MSSAKSRIFGLDVLRATAILLVVISHALRFSPWASPEAAQAELALGYFGVELFFVLSGFLIGTILLRLDEKPLEPSGITNFWMRRWLRTIPAYYATLLLTPVLYLIVFGYTGLTVSGVWPYFFFAQNLWSAHPEFFGVAWSLSVEEWFYLLFPLLLFVMSRMFKPGNGINVLRVLIVLFVVAVIARFVKAENGVAEGWNAGLQKIVLFRLDAIVFGVLAAWLLPKITGANTKRLMLCGGVLVLALVIGLFLYGGPMSNEVNSISAHIIFPLTGIAFALMLPAFAQWKPASGGTFIRSITFISVISYALYLMHSPVWEVYLNYFPEQKSGAGQWMIFTGYILISVAAAAILHYAVEKPFLRLREKRFPAKP